MSQLVKYNVNDPNEGSLFDATGVIGAQTYEVGEYKKCRLVVENVESTNVVKVQGQIKGQSDWLDITSQTDVTTGVTSDIEVYDFIRFNCTTFDPVVVAAVAATASLSTTTPIALTSAAAGAARNTNTLTLQVEAAAANPTDTILADITGTASAIVITITPNDGTNNGATPVDLTTAELVELINTAAVAGKTVTVTDGSGLLNDQTATGGDATALADAGEGDGLVATFSGGADAYNEDGAIFASVFK